MIHDYEDVTGYTLDDDDETSMLAVQNECTFVWSNREGWPVGVIMSYVFVDGRFWLTASQQRKRIAAVERDDRVAVVVTSKGTRFGANRTVTYKGRCRIHRDPETKAWFYPALAAALRPRDEAGAERFARFLDSPRRVILEVAPTQRIGFDGAKMGQATASSSAFRVDQRPKPEDGGTVPLDALPAEFLFTITAHTGDHAPAVLTGAPTGTRIVVTAMRGQFTGPRLKGTVAQVAGGDWVTVRDDGSMKVDVRLVLRTDDGADILMTYSGIGHRDAQGGTSVRTAPMFETGDDRYVWLNGIQAAAHGTADKKSVSYDVYALV